MFLPRGGPYCLVVSTFPYASVSTTVEILFLFHASYEPVARVIIDFLVSFDVAAIDSRFRREKTDLPIRDLITGSFDYLPAILG